MYQMYGWVALEETLNLPCILEVCVLAEIRQIFFFIPGGEIHHFPILNGPLIELSKMDQAKTLNWKANQH